MPPISLDCDEDFDDIWDSLCVCDIPDKNNGYDTGEDNDSIWLSLLSDRDDDVSDDS